MIILLTKVALLSEKKIRNRLEENGNHNQLESAIELKLFANNVFRPVLNIALDSNILIL